MKILQADHSRNYASLALRLVAALMLLHGWPKMMEFSERSESFSDPIGIGGPGSLVLTVFAEVFCTIFLVVGLYTRVATIPLALTMAVAALVVHADDPIQKRESAIIYLGIYIALFFLGGGRFSADNYLRKNSRW